MQRIILADIFGYTEALQTLADQLPGDSLILDPYAGQLMALLDEAQAYECFQTYCSVETYAQQLSIALEQLADPVDVIGFSVGAAALWHVLGSVAPEKISNATGFYGNQIRHALNAEPQRSVTLVLPDSEKHFSVASLADSLGIYPQVSLVRTPYLHGFMNPASVNYSAEGYAEYLLWLQRQSNEA